MASVIMQNYCWIFRSTYSTYQVYRRGGAGLLPLRRCDWCLVTSQVGVHHKIRTVLSCKLASIDGQPVLINYGLMKMVLYMLSMFQLSKGVCKN